MTAEEYFGPFALFVAVELDHETIGKMLGANSASGPEFWLVTKDYVGPKSEPPYAAVGMTPPIPEDFRSPWIGEGVGKMVEWLKGKPNRKEVDFNYHHFAVLDQGAKQDPATMVVCRWGDHQLKGDKVFMLREKLERAIEHIGGADGDAWEEFTDDGKKNAEIEY